LISDGGSTHGTYVNDVRLEQSVDTPLFHGDTIRFGVNVDRGQGMLMSSSYVGLADFVAEIFEAIQVRFEVAWAKPEVIVISDDTPASKVNISLSTNTFTVPDDDDDDDESAYDYKEEEEDYEGEMEFEDEIDDQHADHPSDDSKASVARSLEFDTLHPGETSSVSSVDQNEKPEPKPELAPKLELEPQLEFKQYPAPVEHISSTEEVAFGVLSLSGANVPDPVKKLASEPTNTMSPDIEPLPIPTTASLEAKFQEVDAESLPSDAKLSSSCQTDRFPKTCYQKVPEDCYSNWTMMKPMFMRLADMAWGESDQIPDVDHEKRIIHAARRCSLSRESYWVDDSPGFQPWAGTEVMWTPDSKASDTTFHRMPGNSLKYWAIDKRRYWIIYEDENGLDMGNLWWIVEKPWDILSEEIKEQLATETEIDDCHKCWFIRAWEPQMIGSTWCESPPYWDSSFDKELPSDDDSINSYEAEDSELDEDHSEESAASDFEDYHPFFKFNEETYGCDAEGYSNSEEGSEVDDYSVNSECVSDLTNEEDSDQSVYDESDDNSECSDDLVMEFTKPPKDRSMALPEQSPISVKQRVFAADDIGLPGNDMAEAGPSSFPNDFKSENTKLRDELFTTLNEEWLQPSEIFESHTSRVLPLGGVMSPLMTNPSAQFPTHTVSDKLPSSCQKPVSHPQPSIVVTNRAYQDGPFAINTICSSQDVCTPLEPATAVKTSLKRCASDMESSVLPESGFSQNAQRVPHETASQPDLEPISTGVQDIIASALAENDSAAAENDRPAKRVKPNRSSSKSLASHATTAVVGALLGGLGTIAMLAALPNEYFQ
jgi:hypothetical protein